MLWSMEGEQSPFYKTSEKVYNYLQYLAQDCGLDLPSEPLCTLVAGPLCSMHAMVFLPLEYVILHHNFLQPVNKNGLSLEKLQLYREINLIPHPP
ncbi:hypothetical protein Cadr_000006914 [Camelus dromedarius]|uniref:Uncharacterized protein n=1 Tax=Camelus dromedarius TaxID=9838 RepID=A0A5N4E6F3_CAMDR|nr:hypothetical protein Cadr_000006914 [Camelus dromedarius]